MNTLNTQILNTKELIKKFREDGFLILKNSINQEDINLSQAYAADFLECQQSSESIIQSMEKLESEDRKSFYEFCKRMGQINSTFKIACNENILGIVEGILKTKTVHLVDSAVFYNKLSVKRLQYDWHQENAYFPNVENEVITLWYPWLHAVNEKNGTMVMAKGGNRLTHKRERIPVKDGLTQMKIAEEDLADFEKVSCNIELGDAILFSVHSPHRTGHNSSGVPRSTIITRYTDKMGKFHNTWEPVSYY